MIKNYFIIVWRNLRKNKTFSLINIAGLSIGLACAMLILLYVKDEVSFDRFHKNVNNIYRVVTRSKHRGIEYKDNWYSFFLNTFVVLNPKSSLETIENQMQAFYIHDASETYNEMIKKYGGGADASMGTYFLQSFTDMHMNTELPAQNGLVNASNPMYSYILSGIALFILLIACINFVNLTVARSLKRSKEIGIRKVIGSDRRQLIIQFLGESFLLCFVAFSMALLIVQLILPVFNDLANKALSFSYLFDAKLITGYLLLFLLTGLLAGFYPALILSGYKPVETLYNRFNLSSKNYLQKSLVVLQFALASFLIIATFTIYRQFNFLTKTDLGYDDSNIVEVN